MPDSQTTQVKKIKKASAVLLIEKGATEFDDALVDAADTNQHDMVKLMVEHGATNLDAADMRPQMVTFR